MSGRGPAGPGRPGVDLTEGERQGPTRRDFLALSASAIGALLLAGCDARGARLGERIHVDPGHLGADTGELARLLRAHFGSERLPGVRLVGRAYARRFGDDPDRLAADLAAAAALVAGPADLGPPSAIVRAAVATDLEPPTDLVSVAGWQLARTEARLAALADAVIDPA